MKKEPVKTPVPSPAVAQPPSPTKTETAPPPEAEQVLEMPTTSDTDPIETTPAQANEASLDEAVESEPAVDDEDQKAMPVVEPDEDPILEGIDDTPPEEAEEDARNAPQRLEEERANKKPDSWLRRIFNPSSWRR